MKLKCLGCNKAKIINEHEFECPDDGCDMETFSHFEPRNSEALDEVLSNQTEQPVVSYFVHEADMMHKDADNERLHETLKKVTKDMHKAYIFIIVFLVLMFTIRMFIWNNTITELNKSVIEIASMHHSGCSEVCNAEEADTP